LRSASCCPIKGGRLRPGLFARGEVVAEQRPGVVVSKDALVLRDGKAQVFVASDDGTTAELRTITTGVETPETIEVRAGVKSGDRIIVAGQDAFRTAARSVSRAARTTRQGRGSAGGVGGVDFPGRKTTRQQT
jgi:multidrug efflux pump subunit AcrA (membrane-fusion protein)